MGEKAIESDSGEGLIRCLGYIDETPDWEDWPERDEE